MMTEETLEVLSATEPVVEAEQPIQTTPTPPTKPAKSKLLVVGIGNAGANAIEDCVIRYDPAQNPFMSLLAVESNRTVLDACVDNKDSTEKEYQKHLRKWKKNTGRLSKIQLGEEGLGAGGDTAEGERLAKEKLEQFKLVIADYDHVVFIAGGGGGSAGALPVFAKAVVDAGKTAYAALTMPRINEGREKIEIAEKTYDATVPTCPATRIRNERIKNKKKNFKNFYKEINECSLFSIIWGLRVMLQERGDVADLDGKDWKRGTKVGKYSAFGFFDAKDGFKGLKKGLLGNPYLETENLFKATWIVIFLLGEDLTVEDSDRVSDCIQSEMEDNGTGPGIIIKRHIQTKGLDKGTRMVGFFSFAQEPPPHDREEGKKTKPAKGAAKKEKTLPAGKEEKKQGETETTVATTGESPAQTQTEDQTPTSSTGSSLVVMPSHNQEGATKKVKFFGTINGVRTEGQAPQELVTRHGALFTSNFSSSKLFMEEATQVIKELREETGEIFDIPTRHWK